MISLFLNNLFTPEIQHPFLVRLVSVIVISLEYVSYFCHFSYALKFARNKDNSFFCMKSYSIELV